MRKTLLVSGGFDAGAALWQCFVGNSLVGSVTASLVVAALAMVVTAVAEWRTKYAMLGAARQDCRGQQRRELRRRATSLARQHLLGIEERRINHAGCIHEAANGVDTEGLHLRINRGQVDNESADEPQ